MLHGAGNPDNEQPTVLNRQIKYSIKNQHIFASI